VLAAWRQLEPAEEDFMKRYGLRPYQRWRED
jgi:hypothetical protein